MKTLYRRVRFAYIRDESNVDALVKRLANVADLTDIEREQLENIIPSHRGAPVGVVAYRVVDGVLEVGASFCNTGDSFSKSRGRTLAMSRLDKKPIRADISHVSSDENFYKIVHLLAMRLAVRDGETYAWAGSSIRVQRIVSRVTRRVEHIHLD